MSCLVSLCPVLSCPVVSCPVVSCPRRVRQSVRAVSGSVRQCPAQCPAVCLTCPAVSGTVSGGVSGTFWQCVWRVFAVCVVCVIFCYGVTRAYSLTCEMLCSLLALPRVTAICCNLTRGAPPEHIANTSCQSLSLWQNIFFLAVCLAICKNVVFGLGFVNVGEKILCVVLSVNIASNSGKCVWHFVCLFWHFVCLVWQFVKVGNGGKIRVNSQRTFCVPQFRFWGVKNGTGELFFSIVNINVFSSVPNNINNVNNKC